VHFVNSLSRVTGELTAGLGKYLVQRSRRSYWTNRFMRKLLVFTSAGSMFKKPKHFTTSAIIIRRYKIPTETLSGISRRPKTSSHVVPSCRSGSENDKIRFSAFPVPAYSRTAVTTVNFFSPGDIIYRR